MGFVGYQRSEAWTWEHLALTARAGDFRIGRAQCKGSRRPFAMCSPWNGTGPRSSRMCTTCVERIDRGKGTDDIWDLKHVRGGLVDLEFIAQFLQVVTAPEDPQVLDQNTAQSLEKLTTLPVHCLPGDDAQLLIPAAHLYHNLTQVLRLCLERPFDEKSASAGLVGLLLRATEQPDFQRLQDHLRETVQMVRAAYEPNRRLGLPNRCENTNGGFFATDGADLIRMTVWDARRGSRRDLE